MLKGNEEMKDYYDNMGPKDKNNFIVQARGKLGGELKATLIQEVTKIAQRTNTENFLGSGEYLDEEELEEKYLVICF